jgi:hypothetical protein
VGREDGSDNGGQKYAVGEKTEVIKEGNRTRWGEKTEVIKEGKSTRWGEKTEVIKEGKSTRWGEKTEVIKDNRKTQIFNNECGLLTYLYLFNDTLYTVQSTPRVGNI